MAEESPKSRNRIHCTDHKEKENQKLPEKQGNREQGSMIRRLRKNQEPICFASDQSGDQGLGLPRAKEYSSHSGASGADAAG